MSDTTEQTDAKGATLDPGDERKKIADRPHNWTLFTSIAALLISLGGFALSVVSYQSSSRTASANLSLTQEIQSAYLESDLKLESKLADLDRQSKSDRTKPVKLLLSWTLRNAGNTAATRVTSQWAANFTDLSNSTSRQLGEPNRFGYKMEKHTKQDLPIQLVLTAAEFARFRGDKARVEISGQLHYVDIFNRDHTLNWTAFLSGDGDGILTVRQY